MLMSKFTFIGFVLQCFLFSVLFAEGSLAQQKSIEDIYLSVSIKDTQLKDLFKIISNKTKLSFSYDKTVIDENAVISANITDKSLGDLLRILSKEANLKFKRINENIYVSKRNWLSTADKNVSEQMTQQTRTVIGKVTSAEDNSGIPGVNVIIQDSSTGTVTDIEGSYSINVPDGATLVFSSVGYVGESVEAGNRSVINISLTPDVTQLSEIVVIGYGEKSRKLLTESIGTIDSKEITKVPVASVDAALQGRISGVQVTSVDGTPGSPVAIRIRGVGTVGNTQPLFVIDGIPIGNNAGATTNPLSTINPADIENISVLKDASAAAVYGVRAANGVVLITTKRGKQGKPSISFDGYYGVQKIPSLWDVLNTSQWIQITQEAYDAYNQQNGLTSSDADYLTLHPDVAPGGDYTPEGLAAQGLHEDNWTKDLVNESAPIQNYNLAVSGANDFVNYHVSTGYFSQEAVVKKWDLERYNFRANSDYKVGSRFKFGQTLSISYEDVTRGVNGGGDGFLLNNAATMPPFFQI